jgi:elongator complex protein 2
MACLAMLTPYMYASGAEEKIVRIFESTSAFRNRLKLLADVEDFEIRMAHSATVSSLGLMNKATFDEEINQCESEENSTNIYEPPTEEELTQNTLWPEIQKLYGHGYEIFCMAAKHDGQLLATACRSSNQQHSGILLWDTNTWSIVQNLVFHKLTVTQIAFSPNDKYLLSVSRDRRWSLFKEENDAYVLITANSKIDNPHLRIIWCCSWSQDSNYFATGSRDGKVGIWSIEKIETSPETIIPEIILNIENQSITALCFAPSYIAQCYILAIGYETGRIEIQKVTMNIKNTWSKLIEYDTSQAHHLTVKRLMFRPTKEHLSNILQLASCSSDHAVKIYDIDLSL